MIQLHRDYLLIETSTGESIPCSAELVTIELVGGAAAALEPETVRQAAAAVLYFFKHDLGRESVSISDFSRVLGEVLGSLGFNIRGEPEIKRGEEEFCDLRHLATESGPAGFELAFFPQLRGHFRLLLARGQGVVRFEGLRGCVKHLLGAKRWNGRCQALNDQIVLYLRECLVSEGQSDSCGLVVH